MGIEASDHILARAYRWEKERADNVYLTQPMGGGVVRDLTWKEALDEARRMAAHLRSLGLPPGSRIAILSKNCAHFILSDLAIWMAGHVSVALYPTLNADTIAYILEHSEAKAIFVGKLDTWDAQKSAVPADMPKISYPLSPKNDFPTWDAVVKANAPITDSPLPDYDATSLLVYTSGSTGRPKGVEHTFRSITSATSGIREFYGIRDDDRMISYLPLAHVFERCAIETMSLYTGFHVFFADSLDTFVSDIQRAQPTLFHSVPRLWLKFQQGVLAKMPQQKLHLLLRIPIVSGIVKKKVLNGLGLGQTRLAISGSAPIPPELIQWYRDLGLELLEGYAMSENFCMSHLSKPGRSRVGYVGEAVPGVEVKLSPDHEVLVRGPGNMKGYFKSPEQTKEAFTEDGFLRTGDRGDIDELGRLKITGRVKEIFKTSKGKYVAPTPIENLINADHHVEMSCVSGAGHPQPFALVLLAESLRKSVAEGMADKTAVEASLAKLLEDVNAQVEEYERLQCMVIVTDEWQIENDFLTPTLKLKRSVVEKAYAPQVEIWYGMKKPVIWQNTR